MKNNDSVRLKIIKYKSKKTKLHPKRSQSIPVYIISMQISFLDEQEQSEISSVSDYFEPIARLDNTDRRILR